MTKFILVTTLESRVRDLMRGSRLPNHFRIRVLPDHVKRQRQIEFLSFSQHSKLQHYALAFAYCTYAVLYKIYIDLCTNALQLP